MPELSLLDINPEKLFEQHTVQEVEAIEKAISNEIERKKEELRTLVGERYRDLIEAADSIADMKSLSEEVIQDIDAMMDEMVTLQKKQQQPYKTNIFLKESLITSSISDSVAAQLATMIELPEQIWTEITAKEYIKAAQLFLFARHIKTGFSVEKSLQEFTPQIPILDHQWFIIFHFKEVILESANKDLKAINISPKEASTCLACIALLEGTLLVNKFLQLRTEAVNDILQEESNVKDSIINSCLCIVNTLTVLQHCFLGTNDLPRGLLWEILNSVTSANNKPIYFLEPGIKLKYLPQIVLQFRFNNSSLKSSTDANDINALVYDWIISIKNIVSTRGKALLENVSTLQSLNQLRNNSVRSDFEWAHLLSTFHVKDAFDLWDGIYEILITERAKDLITIHYKDILKGINDSISDALLADEDNKRTNLDLRWFVWKESSDDLNMNTSSNKSVCKGLLLKSKGITPKIGAICIPFEEKLQSLYDDLVSFYSADDILNKDNSKLKKHQQGICLSLLYQLKEHIRSLASDKSINESKLSVLARFLQAIPDLCPTLQKCLILGEDKGSSWHEAKTLLHNESLFFWELWIDKVVDRLKDRIPEMIKKPVLYSDILNMIPQWDIVWIEEGAEGDENAHKSQLKVPSAPSFPLQTLLHFITTELCRAHIPRLLRENLIQKILPYIFDCYDPSTFLCQAELMQNLYDIKYLYAQFIPITNKELNILAQQKISQIEKQIDPFDLEVFLPLIKTNVKLSIQKMQGMFGMMYNNDDGPSSIKISDDPCILALSKSANDVWFPMLPVTNPTNIPLHIIKPKVVKQEKQMADVDNSKNAPSSTSFFSDWFS